MYELQPPFIPEPHIYDFIRAKMKDNTQSESCETLVLAIAVNVFKGYKICFLPHGTMLNFHEVPSFKSWRVDLLLFSVLPGSRVQG